MKRILVVDDDHELASLLAFALQRQGYVVELATNGSDALERVRRARFDVVVVSGAPEAATQALRLGAAAVIAKPFRFDELEQVLAHLIDAPESDAGCQC